MLGERIETKCYKQLMSFLKTYGLDTAPRLGREPYEAKRPAVGAVVRLAKACSAPGPTIIFDI